MRLVPIQKIAKPITTASVLELCQLMASLASAKTPSDYLTRVCHQLKNFHDSPVSGFICGPNRTHQYIIEDTLPEAIRGIIKYPAQENTSNISKWPSSANLAQIQAALPDIRPQLYTLSWRDATLGGIVLWTPKQLSPEHEMIVKVLLPLISNNLKTLLLEESTNTSLAEAATLQKITQAITGTLDFDTVTNTLLNQARDFFHVDAAALSLFAEDKDEFAVEQSVGLTPSYVAELHFSKTAPIFKALEKTAAPIQMHDLETGPVTGKPALSRAEGVRSALIIPIISGKQLVGTLGLISKTARTFTEAELRFGQSLAEHVGIAFANANLHASLRKASNEIEQTRNLMRDGLMVFDLEHRLHYFNASAGSIFGLNQQILMKPFSPRTSKSISGLSINNDEFETAINQALGGTIARIQFSVTSKLTSYYEAIFSPYRDNKGILIGALMNIRDISSLYLEKEKLQAIQNGISDGLILVGQDGHTLEYNEEWLRLFSVKSQQVGESFFKMLSERKNFSCDHNLVEVIASALRGRSVTCYAHDQEHGRHIQLSVNPIRIGGQITGAVATARDITSLIEKTVESNEMAAKAHRHLRELTQLAELSGIVGFNVASIYQKYLSKTVTLLDSSSVSLYLYNPSKQLLEQGQSTNPAPGDVPTLELSSKHLAARAFTSRQPVTIEGEGHNMHRIALPITHHSKTLGVLLVGRTGSSYGDHEAKLLRMVATRLAVLVENASLYHDVNARRERWEAVFRFTDEGIVIFDRTGTIVGFNPASTQITQYHTAEAIGKPFSKIIKNVSPDTISGTNIGQVERVLEEGVTIAKSEQLIENRGGSRVWTEISYSPIFDDAGRVTSGIAIIRNTTKDREVEEIKSDFISIVSHELRTPLTAIKGFLSMTLKHDFGPLSEKQFHYLSRVYQSNQRMIDLVEDLMDATYIESGKITLNISPVALDSIVGNVVSEVAAKGAAGQIMINVKRRQRLPLVLADETRLHQIVLNLIDNAIKYSMPGTEVEVSFRVQGDELITTVSDHGVGIGKGQIERLFTKFGRIFNPLSVQAGGTGLGLYIVKNLIESHDGRIWVASTEGKGSKFNFSLPIAKQLPLIE